MNNRQVIIATAVVIGIIFLGALYYFFFVSSKNQTPKIPNTPAAETKSPISGELDLNGHIPPNTTIKILTKELPKGEFQTAVANLAAQNGSVWQYSEANAGSTYEIQAQLLTDGAMVDSSQSTVVVAPASGIVLRINSSAKHPETVPPVSTISGVLNINGYIPQGSTISLSAQKQSGSNFETVVTGLAAKDQGQWTWNSALAGQTYNLKASLVSASTEISVSALQVITAPATNELITINSTAKPPAPTIVSIKGTVNYNGNLSGSPTFSLGVRKTGTQNFVNAVNDASVSQGMSWNYPNATPGVSYDIQGYLWSNGKPYSQSQILTVTAPASVETLTINAQTQPPAPAGGTINVSCGGQQNNLYQATVNFNTQNNLQTPQQYQVTIGSSTGANNMYNSTVSPSNPNGSQSLTTNNLFSKAVNYYAQYAYSSCQGGNCSTFSSVSPSAAFNCQ